MRAAPAPCALLLALLAGCAHLPGPGPEPTTAAASFEAPPLDRQVMVTLPPGPQRLWARVVRDLAAVYNLQLLYQWPMLTLDEPCIVFAVPEDRSVGEIVQLLAADRRVELAQPVQTFRVLAEETAETADPYTHLQHSARTLRLQAAHRRATGAGVKVALVDTGVDFSHPDLAGRVVEARSFLLTRDETFTSDQHGTAVAGVIAADAGNREGIVGVAPGARLYALKACWQDPPGARQAVCNSYTLAQAVDHAVAEEAQVLNLSLTGPRDPLLERLLLAALERGVVVVAASPGEGAGEPFPASLPGILAVGATDLEDRLRFPPPEQLERPLLAAPGVDVLTTVPRASYDFFSGSSMAAAHASGVVALLLELRGDLSARQVREILVRSGRPTTPAGAEPGAAGRLLDACAALDQLTGRGDCDG